MITGRVIRHSASHRDYYLYSHALEKWVKVKCSIDPAMLCTGKGLLPRGYGGFNYNFKRTGLSEDIMYYSLDEIERGYVVVESDTRVIYGDPIEEVIQ